MITYRFEVGLATGDETSRNLNIIYIIKYHINYKIDNTLSSLISSILSVCMYLYIPKQRRLYCCRALVNKSP